MKDLFRFFPPEKTRTGVLMLLAFLLPFLWICAIRGICMNGGESGNDAYYHAAAAQQGPAVFCAKTFPTLELSIWKENFANKELLYHTVLWGLFSLEKLFQISPEAPFHFPALFFMALALGGFIFAMKRFGVSPELMIPMTLLGVMSCSNILFRFMMLRPHVLSLAWMLLLCGILLKGSPGSRISGCFLVSLFYTWSYSNPQFILLPAAAFSIAAWIDQKDKRFLWGIGAAVLGILTALILHPQFPNTFYIWKVQTLDAVLGPVLAISGKSYSSLMAPMEMSNPGLSFVRDAAGLYLLEYFVLLTFARLISVKGFKNISPYLSAAVALSVLYVGGTFVVQRTMEYAAPFAALAGSFVFHTALQEKVFLPWKETPQRFCRVLLLCALLLASIAVLLNISHKRLSTPPAEKIGKWMEKNLPEGTLVVNLNWGDFPAIYHANRKQRFFWGMDPVFSLAKDPERTRKFEEMLRDPRKLTPTRFYRLTSTRYALVLSRREAFVRYMKSMGWTALYEDPSGTVFYVQ